MIKDLLVDGKYRVVFAFGLFLLLLLCFRYSRNTRAALKSRQLFWIVAGVGLVCALTYALIATLILLYPNYVNEFETSVAIVSWRGIHGYPIYPDWRTENIHDLFFGAPYGPLLFMTNGAVLHFIPT